MQLIYNVEVLLLVHEWELFYEGASFLEQVVPKFVASGQVRKCTNVKLGSYFKAVARNRRNRIPPASEVVDVYDASHEGAGVYLIWSFKVYIW